MKTINILVFAVFVMVISTASLASATGQLTVDSLEKTVPLGGTVDFTVTVNDTEAQTAATLQWVTGNPNITANIPGLGSFVQAGSYNPVVIAANTPTTFTLRVKADANATVGSKVNVRVFYLDQVADLQAVVTTSVVPTPEVPTSALMAVGLIGLVSVVRFGRKN